MFLPPPQLNRRQTQDSRTLSTKDDASCRRSRSADGGMCMDSNAGGGRGTGERRQSTLAECAVDSFGGSMADRRTHHLAAASGASCLVPYRGEQPAASCLRVYCLPHAGGSASLFWPWRSLLPPEIELWGIEYPGHGRR